MKLFKKTYRLLSALTLILFLSSVVVPASLSAASLLCGMDITAMHASAKQCCDMHKADVLGEVAFDTRTSDCKIQQICAHDGIEKNLQIEATIPHLPTDMAAIAIETFYQRAFVEDRPAAVKAFQPFLAHSQPPLFLLNSTFLN